MVGFNSLSRIAVRQGNLRTTNALPARPTSHQEFFRGAALGWAMLLAVVLPLMLTGVLRPTFSLTFRDLTTAGISLITLFVGTLAVQLAFRGFVFARLIAAIGPTLATIALSLLYAIVSTFLHPTISTPLSVAIEFLFGVLLSVAYLRTNALWLGWGLQFAWTAATALIFGLPVAGLTTYASLIDTKTSGPFWWSGGTYGPEGSVITCLVLIAGMILLYRITRDYAWNYTHPEILPAGVAVVIAPPKAHTEMEEAASARPVPLVQILSATPTASSTMDVIDKHLRRDANDLD